MIRYIGPVQEKFQWKIYTTQVIEPRTENSEFLFLKYKSCLNIVIMGYIDYVKYCFLPLGYRFCGISYNNPAQNRP